MNPSTLQPFNHSTTARRRGDAAARAVASAAGAPVSPAQVRALAVTARRAYEAQRGLGLADGTFDEWRRAALWDACRRDSFRALGQGDWEAAMARFRTLADGVARGEAAARAEGARKRAAWALARDCLAFADEGLFDGPDGAEAYAASIARDVFWRPLGELSAEELSKVRFTLRNRARRRRARMAGGAEGPQDRAGSPGGPRT